MCHMIQAHEIKPLLQRIAFERDERAYKLLFLHFHKSLRRFAYSYVKQQDAAEEIISDVFMKLWLMNETLADITNIKVYLFTAVKNTAMNYLAKNRKYTSWDIDAITPEFDLSVYTPEDLLLRQELQQTIAATIRSLPPKCQMAYTLVRENGFTYKEVAAIMDISENTVDRHLGIAMRKLGESVKTYLRINS